MKKHCSATSTTDCGRRQIGSWCFNTALQSTQQWWRSTTKICFIRKKISDSFRPPSIRPSSYCAINFLNKNNIMHGARVETHTHTTSVLNTSSSTDAWNPASSRDGPKDANSSRGWRCCIGEQLTRKTTHPIYMSNVMMVTCWQTCAIWDGGKDEDWHLHLVIPPLVSHAIKIPVGETGKTLPDVMPKVINIPLGLFILC